MAQNVKFTKGDTAKINGASVTDGQLLYNTTTGQHYIDNESTRVEVGKPVVNTMAEVSAITEDNISCGTKPVKELIANLESFICNGMAHNGIYRGKNLTNVYTNAQLSAMVQDGTFKDIYIGDYIEKTITTSLGGTEKVRLVFAGFDTFLHNGAPEVTSHHAVMVPENCFGATAQMNATNATTGGYVASAMHTTVLPVYYAALNGVLDNHILTHSRVLTKSISTTGTSSAGAGLVGYANSRDWYNVNLCLISEIMLYGSTVCSSSFYDTGDANMQLPLFRLDPGKKVAKLGQGGSRYNFWLCAVASSAQFAFCTGSGYAYCTDASDSSGVRPYFLFA